LKIEEGELPANYTNMHEKRIKAVLLFRYPAIQPSSHPAIQPCFSIKKRIGMSCHRKAMGASFCYSYQCDYV